MIKTKKRQAIKSQIKRNNKRGKRPVFIFCDADTSQVQVFLFGPPGCTATTLVLTVHLTVQATVVFMFKEVRVSAGAFSGRPAIDGRHLL